MRPNLIARAVCLALAFPAGLAAAGPATHAKPDTLLAIDQNRSAVIDGIVGSWGAPAAFILLGLILTILGVAGVIYLNYVR